MYLLVQHMVRFYNPECLLSGNYSVFKYTAEPGYSVLGLCDISSITLHILWYQLIPHKAGVFLPCLVCQT
jgi:hypothetical protein